MNSPLDPAINYATSKTIATVTVRATAPNGAVADTSIYVDYSKLVDNYLYTSIMFDPSVSVLVPLEADCSLFVKVLNIFPPF